MRPNEMAYSNSLFGAIRPLIKHARQLLGVAIFFGLVTGIIVWLMPRRYEAAMTLSTINNSRSPAISGGLGSILAGASLGMSGPNPALITRIAGEYGVLLRVAKSPLNPNSRETIADRLQRVSGSSIEKRDLVRELRKMIGAGVDKASGVIVVSAISKDSALARSVTQAVVRETSKTFIGITRSQGAEIHLAMQQRLDSAASQLRTAEERQRQFLESNRFVAPFSAAAIEGSKLRQAVDLAQQVYTQTLTDREGAVAKELEATPAVVVIDPVPEELAPLPRYLFYKSLAASFLAAIIFGLIVVARESARRSALEGDPDAIHFSQSARGARFGGPILRWLFPVLEADKFDLSVARVETAVTPPKRLTPRPPERAQGE